MGQDDPLDHRPRPRAEAWAGTIDGVRRRAGAVLPGQFGAALSNTQRRLSEWALAEAAPGRLLPWLPVAFGAGIVLYFSADREPAVWAVVPLLVGAIALAVAARRRSIGFPVAL